MSIKFDSLNEAEIAKIGQLVEILAKSSFDHLTLELDDFKLTVGTGNVVPETAAPAAAPVVTAAPVAAPATPSMAAPATATPDATAPAAAPASKPEDGLVDVTATTMGRFYSRPEPGAPPFVTVGGQVDADGTVGLVEVMKLFNGVSAGVAGTVAEICVEDAQLVEFGQVLMRIRPAE